MHVLMIEDNEDDYLLFRRNVAKSGDMHIEWCDTLAKGLDHIESHSVDMLLLDMALPDGDGLGIFDRMRSQFPALPIVIMSGTGTDEIALEAIRRGAQDYLIKGQISGEMVTRSLRYAVERKRAEERFRALLESAPDAMVIVNQQGSIELVNSQAEKLFGYTRNELSGQPVEMLIPGTFRNRHLAHRGGYVADPHLRGMGVGLELYALRKDGNQFPVEISLSPIQTSEGMLISSAIRDITERKRIEHALTAEHNLLRTLIDRIPDYIFVKDTQSRFVMANNAVLAAANITTADELIGKTNFDFFPADIAQPFYDDEQRVIASGQALLNKEEASVDLRTGQQLWFLTTKAPLRDEYGAITGLLGISRNITEDKKMQKQNFDLALDRERFLLLSQFVRDTSHDLRTPLTVINTSTFLLKRLPPDKQLEKIELIEAQVGTINKMLETIHYTAQLWSTDHLDLQPVNLDSVIQDICDRIGAEMTAKKQHLNIMVEPLTIMAEPTYLSQALFEILDNASGFTLENGQIEVRQSIRNQFVSVEFKDNGLGMSEAEVSKAFEMFWRADHSRNDSREHHGLGLAIAHRIIGLHRGSIQVESQPGAGTTFTVLLPLHAS